MSTGDVVVLSVTAATMTTPGISDNAQVTPQGAEAAAAKATKSTLEHARDIDGVQLIRQHQNLLSTSQGMYDKCCCAARLCSLFVIIFIFITFI